MNSMDRISQLPEAILHHILCYLPQNDAVRTCVLSKPWRHLGSSRPKIEFGLELFDGNKEIYVSVLDKTLQRYHDQNLSIQEFILETSEEFLESVLEKWLPVVLLKMGVIKFHLTFLSLYEEPENVFRLPSALLKAESLKELNLENCKMCEINPVVDKVLCKNLLKLSLCLVYITDATLEKIMSSCPLIEYLDICSCAGLQSIKVTKAHNLKCLCLYRVPLSKESIQSFSTNLPCLEKLNITLLSGTEQFQISSRSIKHLTIAVGESFKAAIIDATNILCFEFSCDLLPLISFTTTSTEWKSIIRVGATPGFGKDGSWWAVKLLEICKALSTSQISLHVYGIPCDSCVDLSQPFVIENLSMLRVEYPLVRIILDRLFLTVCPKNIQQTWYADNSSSNNERENELIVFLCHILLIERERAILFGEYNLEDARMEACDENGEEWRSVEGTSSLSGFALPWDGRLKIRFRLKWAE